MIVLSEQSKRNIDLAFQHAARATLPKAGDPCEIVAATAAEWGGTAANLLVITISSFSFRLMIIFRIEESPEAYAYYVNGAVRRLNEVFAETANLCCGMLSARLAQTFSHIGMSIPYELYDSCFRHLGDLRPQYLSSFKVKINESVQLQVTLCMCCSATVEVKDGAEEQEEQRGSLELF